MQKLEDHITSDIKGLIFDLDGTLADTIPLHQEAWQRTGKMLGFKVTGQMIKDYSGTPTEKISVILNEKYNWGIEPELITKTKLDNYHKIKKSHGKIQPINLILEIARKFHNVLPMSVGTGSRRINALKSLEDIEAMHLFEGIVTATDVNFPKPHPETFYKCADLMSVKPQDCLVFEDGAMGIKAAIDGGMKLLDVKPYLS